MNLRPGLPPGFVPITELVEDDIFVVGYPKSGNTWSQDLVAGTVFGVLPEFAPPELALDLVPDVHASPCYKRYATPMYFKSHSLPDPAYKNVVYLLRDGRDVMVSYFYHRLALEGPVAPVDFLEMVQTGKGLFLSKWHQHVEAWLSNPFSARMIVIKYEDLKEDTARELDGFCKFAGVDRSTEFLRMIAQGTTFDKMQKREMNLGLGDPQWPKEKLFRRRGVVGSYKDEMPAEALQAFLAESGDVLHRCGYL
jgi:hypothetical protein